MKTKITSALVCFALSISVNLKAQSTGTITGTVVDAETGETLIGVNVVIEGSTKGTSTDLDGFYQIRNVAPGTYTLVVSYVSFQRQIITGVEVTEGEAAKLDLSLRPETETLDDVIVTAEIIRDNEAGLLRERQKSIAFSDAISIEAISKTGGGNAADALSKVSGASVVGGKYVYVRGLGDRYNNSQLNGINLPSADPDKNATQFDLFPANLLSSIVTTKTFTPDQPGNFTGGNVDIRTKNYPEKFTFSAGSSVSYNSQSSFADNFLAGERSRTDFLGFDANRGIPSIIQENGYQVPSTTTARRNADEALLITDITHAFGDEMRPTEHEEFTSFSNSITFGNQKELFGRKFGFIFSFNYGTDVNHYADGVSRDWVATDPEANELSDNYNFSDHKSDLSVNWGFLSNLSYQFNPSNEITLRYLRTQDGTSTGRIQEGPFIKNTQSENVIFETFVTKYVERNVESFQLSGEHAIGKSKRFKVNWDASISENGQSEPNLRFFFHEYSEVNTPDTSYRNYSINLGSSNATRPTRVFRDLNETNQQVNFSTGFPVDLRLSRDVKFKFGGSYLVKERRFSEFKFDYNDGGLRYRDFNGDIFAYYSSDVIGVIDTTSSGIFRFGQTISNASIPSNNYQGDQTISAGFGMIELPLLSNLTFVGGTRLENTYIKIISQDSTREPGVINESDLLPSAGIIYNLTDNMNLRMAVTRTIGRPTFREFAPFSAFDFAGGRITAGNPELGRALINNYDFRWEWFTRAGEIIAASLFYKKFSNPIERVIVSNNNQETYQNVDDAEVYGLELEARTRLDWISEKLEFFTIAGNYAFTRSFVEVPERELEFASGFDISPTRPFQGQSPYIINISAGYENPKTGTTASLSYNRFGDRLDAVSVGGSPNIYEFGRNDLYLSVGQKLFNHLSVKLSLDNLLNEPFRTGQTYKGQQYTVTEYNTGRTFKISVTYDF